MPALDGVRGLAILFVLVLHFVGVIEPASGAEALVFGIAQKGMYGVDLFFILSGFLITGILMDARGRPHYFRNFYARRALRIFPLYYFVLTIVFVVLPLFVATQDTALERLLSNQAWAWLYGVNVFQALQGAWALPYLDHLWSLAVEEHFYLVWPLVIWAVGRSPGAVAVTAGCVFAATNAARLVAALNGVSAHALYVLTPFRLDGLALGGFFAAIARLPTGPQRLVHWLPRLTLCALMAAATSVLWNRLTPGSFVLRASLRYVLIQLLLAALLLWALVPSVASRALSAIFESRFLTRLGTYSYGLYVYHHFISHYFLTHRVDLALLKWVGSHSIAVAVAGVGGMATSYALAWASYRWLERPFLGLKRHFEGSEADSRGSKAVAST